MEGEPDRGLSADELGAGLFVLFTLLCNLVPTFAHQLFPGGEVPDKETAFFTVYFTTLPLSLAITAIAFIWLRRELDTDGQRLAASAAIMVVSGFVGLGLGSTQADQEFMARAHGPGWVVLAEYALYVTFSYAIFYGWALFLSALGAGAFGGYWLHEKVS